MPLLVACARNQLMPLFFPSRSGQPFHELCNATALESTSGLFCGGLYWGTYDVPSIIPSSYRIPTYVRARLFRLHVGALAIYLWRLSSGRSAQKTTCVVPRQTRPLSP